MHRPDVQIPIVGKNSLPAPISRSASSGFWASVASPGSCFSAGLPALNFHLALVETHSWIGGRVEQRLTP
jgi:hypothetical protein